MIRKLAPYAAHLLWILPALVLWASFPPIGEKMDSLFALAPLMWLSRQGNTRRSLRYWFAAGLLFWLATLSWMYAIVKNGGPFPLIFIAHLVLGTYCALYFGAYGWFSARLWQWVNLGSYGRRLFAILVAEPLLWAGLELVRSRLFGGFARNHLGVCAVNARFGAPAALGGVYLVSALAILVNGTLASIAERMVAQLRPAMARSATAAVPQKLRSVETFLPLAIVWLFFRISAVPAATPAAPAAAQESKPIGIALIQRNFPSIFSNRKEDAAAVYGSLFANVAPLKPDLVILPESALAEFGMATSRIAERFAAWAREITDARAILAGGGRLDDSGREYNSAILSSAADAATDAAAAPAAEPLVYDKVHLVPFGEYIPGDKLFPALQRLAPVGSCWPGKLQTLDFDGIPLGVAICFEDTDSAQMRSLAALGARLLVFITNDSWFSHSTEAVQHSWQAVARAIETGLPIARVGNSGVTGTITADGKAQWLTSPRGEPIVDKSGVMVERITPALEISGARTWYVLLGDAPLAVAFTLLLIAIAVHSFRNR